MAGQFVRLSTLVKKKFRVSRFEYSKLDIIDVCRKEREKDRYLTTIQRTFNKRFIIAKLLEWTD